MKSFLTSISLLLSITVFGQQKNAKNNVIDANNYSVKAQNSGEEGLSEVTKCAAATAVSKVQYFIGRAKSDMDAAMAASRGARDKAEDASNAAHNFNCTEAVTDGSNAQDFFQNAYDNFDQANDKLNQASSEDEVSVMNADLNDASDNINTALSYLKKGAGALVDTSTDIDNCK